MPLVVMKPSEFVNFLTSPGLPVNDMNIPLKQYMCAEPKFGGNKEASEVISFVNQNIYLDEATKTKISTLTRNLGRLTTGQGYPQDFILVMKHMADNMDKLRTSKQLKNKSYFREQLSTREVLIRMVREKVFGLDCIGFISQYLVASRVWTEYKTYYPKDYTREFKPIKKLSEIRRLCLVIWDNYHIGIIDKVWSCDESKNECVVDICQSSVRDDVMGPQTNRRVTLKLSPNDFYSNHQKFLIGGIGSPPMPITHPVYIAKMPDLNFLPDLIPDALGEWV